MRHGETEKNRESDLKIRRNTEEDSEGDDVDEGKKDRERQWETDAERDIECR